MSLKDFAGFLLIGRLIIWLTQTNGLIDSLWGKHKKLEELRDCDLCLGFWVYLIMAILQWRKPFKIFPRPFEWFTLAGIASFAMHLIRLGWGLKFNGVVIDDALQ